MANPTGLSAKQIKARYPNLDAQVILDALDDGEPENEYALDRAERLMGGNFGVVDIFSCWVQFFRSMLKENFWEGCNGKPDRSGPYTSCFTRNGFPKA